MITDFPRCEEIPEGFLLEDSQIRWSLAEGGFGMRGLTWAARTRSIVVFIW